MLFKQAYISNCQLQRNIQTLLIKDLLFLKYLGSKILIRVQDHSCILIQILMVSKTTDIILNNRMITLKVYKQLMKVQKFHREYVNTDKAN